MTPGGGRGPVDRIPPEHIRSLREIEREHIEHAILACQSDLTLAAAYLGISRRTIYYKLKRWCKEDEDAKRPPTGWQGAALFESMPL